MDWRLVLLSFGLLIVAELGDKTPACGLQSGESYRAPFPVFVGASLALTVLTLIAAIAGQFVSSVVRFQYIQIGSGLMFIGIGAAILWQAFCSVSGR